MTRLMQIQTLNLTLKTAHFKTLFSNSFCSITKKITLMLSVLYFISEVPSLYVFVGEGGLIKVLSSWHNHLPKCAKMHFSEAQILKISRGRPPGPPQWEGASPIPYPPPHAPRARVRRWGACKALGHLIILL